MLFLFPCFQQTEHLVWREKWWIFWEWKHFTHPDAQWARRAEICKSHSQGGRYKHQRRPSSALLTCSFYSPLAQQIEHGMRGCTKYGILSKWKHLGHSTLQHGGRKRWRFPFHECLLSNRMSCTFTSQKSCWFHLAASIRVFPALNPRLRRRQGVY